MFKNPLKYQEGGKAGASQEQLVQLFQAAAENAQVDPEQLVQKASEIGQDEEAAAQFMQGLQLCAQGDPEGIKFIKSLFQSPAFKKGGKIFEFICKHKKGGYVAGCGCKQEGGEIEGNKQLMPIGIPMQNGGMMQRSLPFTVNSLGMENDNPAEFEKKAIMMRQRPMYAKDGLSGVGESEKNKEKRSNSKYNGSVSHDSNDYMFMETVGPLHRVIRAAYNKPSQLDTIIYSKADRGYTSPYSNNEYWMDDAGIQKVDPIRWKRLNQGFDDAKNAELDALMDQAGFEQVREEPKKRWWLGCGGEVEKHQQDNGKGSGIIGGIFNLYNRFIGKRMPDTVDARDRRLKTWVDRNGVQHFVEDANVNGNFTTTSFNVYQPGDTSDVNQKITIGDGRTRIVNLQPGTPQRRTVISRNIQENK